MEKRDYKGLVCSIKNLQVRSKRQYRGPAFVNIVLHNRRLYLNVAFTLKMKSKNKWLPIADYNISVPLPALAKILSYVKKEFGINYNSTKQRKWKFKENADFSRYKKNL